MMLRNIVIVIVIIGYAVQTCYRYLCTYICMITRWVFVLRADSDIVF